MIAQNATINAARQRLKNEWLEKVGSMQGLDDEDLDGDGLMDANEIKVAQQKLLKIRPAKSANVEMVTLGGRKEPSYECDLIQCHAFFDPYVISSPDGSLSEAAEFRRIIVNIDCALAQGLPGKKYASPEVQEAVLKDVEDAFAAGQRLSFQVFQVIIASLYEIQAAQPEELNTLCAELTSQLCEALANKEDTTDLLLKLKAAAHKLDMLDGKVDGMVNEEVINLDIL